MNNALFKDQIEAGVPNLFPLSAARSMFEPFSKLKFYGAATYVDQVRAGINYFVTKKGKKVVCAMYQDTDFGKEVLRRRPAPGRQDEDQARGDHHPQADRPGLHRADHQAQGGGLRSGGGGHHRARLRSCPTPPRARSAGPTWTSSARPRATTSVGGRRPGWRHRGLLRHGADRHALPRHAEPRRPGLVRPLQGPVQDRAEYRRGLRPGRRRSHGDGAREGGQGPDHRQLHQGAWSRSRATRTSSTARR